MTKVVYNACYGGFYLSAEAVQRGREISGDPKWGGGYDHKPRHDPVLVQVVEELGEAASVRYSKLAIAEVPSGSRYRIDEYDGNELVMTPEDYEWEVAP